MSTLLDRLVGDADSLGDAGWKKPKYLLDAIAKRKKKGRKSSVDARYASLLAFAQSRGDAPAPPKDRVKGSDVNDEGSAKNKSGDISLSDATVAALKAKVEEHNTAMRERKRPDWTHVRLGSLKAVWRRGAGAFSTSHRPGMTRDRWAMARVNAFLALARRGRPENPKYVSDFDLLHTKHPKHSDSRGFCRRSDDCGRDENGRFTSGNKCGTPSDSPKEDPRGRLRYGDGTQTDAARKLYQMGSSEKKLRGLVDAMGGVASNTRVDINPPSVNISVANASGQKLFHVDLDNNRARVYPMRDLGGDAVAKIRDAAKEAFPVGNESGFKLTVFRKAADFKKWQAENDAKLKAWEDKYKFSTLLPPHQRPKKWENRDADCTRNPDGTFGSGNKCQEEGDGAVAVAEPKPGGWGENEKEWGTSGSETEVYKPKDKLFDGAELISEIRLRTDGLKDALKSAGVSLPHAIAASGLNPAAMKQAGVGGIHVSVSTYNDEDGVDKVLVMWSARTGTPSRRNAVEAQRLITKNGRGELEIVAESFSIDPDYQGRGIAREMMRSMIASGASQIVMRNAIGGDGFSGYFQWPKYGYNASMQKVQRASQDRSIPPQFSKAKSLLGIYAMPGGREWWKESGGDIALRFDCTPGSESMRVFAAYDEATNRKLASRSVPRGDGDGQVGTDCDFDPTLDEVWDEIVKSGTLRGQARSLDARHAALLAFSQSRDAGCVRTPDGKFGSGNKCQEEGGGATSNDVDGVSVSLMPTPPAANYIQLATGELSDADYLQGMFRGGYASDIEHFRYQSAVARQVGKAGVDLEVDTHTRDGRRTVDSVRAVSVGVQFAIDAGLKLPERVLIGDTSRYVGSSAFACFVHEPYAPVPTIAIDRALSADEVSDRILANWLAGDPSKPLETLFAHELSHLEHYDSLPPAAQARWEKWTGLPQYLEAKRDAELNGRIFRPSAGTLEGLAWDRSLRVSDLSMLSGAQAMDVARKHVSGYAAKNPLEFVAEFRTGVLMGKSYPDEAWSLYDDYGGPKIPKAKNK